MTYQKPIAGGLLVGLLAAMPALAQEAANPAAALEELESTVLSRGPNGEEPTAASEITLSEEEIAQIREMGATAAIVMHYGGNDWSQAQIEGLQSEFENLGVEVIAVTDAGFKPEKQVADLETIMAQSPDVIVSIPTDPSATAGAYRSAGEAGTHLVFMDNVPAGFTAGEDYVSAVSADNYGNGVAAGHLMAQALDGEGEVGMVFHAADFFVTQQRYDGFKEAISEYPGIEIVAEQGIGGPDFTGDAEKAASAMLISNPGINGIWAVWDVPAEGVISAARFNGRDNLVITTNDLGENVAINMAQDGFVKGLGAQRPFDQGVTEARLAGYALLGKDVPAFVALPALPITRDTLIEGWEQVYRTEPTDNIIQSMQ